MADNKVSNDLFEAINIITLKALLSVNFNATKKCTITDNTNAKNGTYGVSDGTTSFIAYSQDTTYRLNDTVLVLIPNNDFNQLKMIIGKWKNEDDNKPYNYQAPFDLMIDMTQNIIDSPISGGLIANDRANATDTLDNTWNEENYLDNTETSGGSWRTIYYKSFLDNPLVGYTRLGLAADFRTLISAVEGNFGLRLTIGSNQNNDISLNTSSLSFVSYLDVTDMIGNIYNSTIGTRQEKVFDISSLGPIYYISLDLYEEIGTFFDITPEGEMIFTPYLLTETGVESIDTQGNWGINADSRVGQNIFVDNCYICLGYEQSYFTQESAFLYHNDSNTYDNTTETKQVFLRWAHKTKNGNFIIVNESTELDKEYTIYWYELDYSYAGDLYSGNYWKKLESFNNQFSCSFTPRYDTYQQEKIKCVILYDSNVILSNSVIYDNTANTLQVLSTTLNRGLNIVCGDRSGGIYPIYDEHFESVKPAAASSLYAVINDKALDVQVDINDLLPIDGIDSIIWEVPIKNSLLTFYWDGNPVTSSNNTAMVGNSSATGESADSLNKLTYMVSNRYNPNYTNNTIKCTIIKDGLTYQTSLAFTFGLASTNGYPYALTVTCTNSSKPVLYTDIENNLLFLIHCYDLNNNMSEVGAESITCKLNDEILTPQNNVITITKSNVSITTFYILHIIYTFNNITLTKDIPIPVLKYGSNANDYINNTAPYIYYNTDGSLSNKAGLTFKHTASSDNYGFLLFKNSANCGYISDNFIGKMQNNTFAPVSQYIDNVELFGVAYGPINDGSIGSADVVWQCPIIKEQYRYPYAAINLWNGMDISINNTNGNLLAPRLGAGKKNANNTFSGVILGDWSSTSNIDGIENGMTGLYGFQNGAVTYAFNDDGTAFIGGSGEGRIYFDGTRGTITSNNYQANSAGMLIDLTDGKIDMINSAGHIILDTTNNNLLFNISTGNKTLINIGTNSYYLLSSNYSDNNGTKLDLQNGKLITNDIIAKNGSFKGHVEATVITATEIQGNNTGIIQSLKQLHSTQGQINDLRGTKLDYDNLYIANLFGKSNTTVPARGILAYRYRIEQNVNGFYHFILEKLSNLSENLSVFSSEDQFTIIVYGLNNIPSITQTFTFNSNENLPINIVTSLTSVNLCYVSGNSETASCNINSSNQTIIFTKLPSISSATSGNLTVLCTGNIIPSNTTTYSLGSSDKPWSTIYGTLQGNGSARSIKNNIQSLLLKDSLFFDYLEPRKYQYNNTDIKYYHKGFIVDEVCAAAASAGLKPEDCGVMFSTDEKDPNDPNASLCYNDFIALNTWQIQLLKKRVQTLEEKIKQLEAKLNEN